MCKNNRNNIASGDIYDIKPKDMIYNKVYKEKNKAKKVCEKVPPEKSIDYRPAVANARKEIIVKLPSKEAKEVAKA